jgi:arylsulfatase A-like enzyme
MFRAMLAIAALSLWIAATAAAADRRPNVVILLADDLGYADVGFQGCRDIPTPHIDALAAGGVRCTNGYVSGPYCSPSRAGLLTGRYQQRFGHEFNPGPQGEPGGARVESIGMPLAETTLADRLKAAGYATALVGKWHLGAAPKFQPPERGFDEFFGFLGGAQVYLPNLPFLVFPELQDAPGENTGRPQASMRPRGPLYRGTQPVEEPEYLTDALAREAVSFIERHRQKPFFLYLSFNAVHTPMHATEQGLQAFAEISDPRRRAYAAMAESMDQAIGRVLDKLRAAGLEQDTLVFFLSDNGGPTVPRAAINASRNAPLRGSKVSTLEGGIRVPFVVSWKGRLPAGKTYDQPVIQLDIVPTALAAAQVDLPAGSQLDGVDLVPYLAGKKSGTPHEALYWRLGPQRAVRQGDWKLVRYTREFAGEEPPAELSPPRLYNLRDDIGETTDLATAQPDKAKELEGLWQRWNATLVEPLWPQQAYLPEPGSKRP